MSQIPPYFGCFFSLIFHHFFFFLLYLNVFYNVQMYSYSKLYLAIILPSNCQQLR